MQSLTEWQKCFFFTNEKGLAGFRAGQAPTGRQFAFVYFFYFKKSIQSFRVWYDLNEPAI